MHPTRTPALVLLLSAAATAGCELLESSDETLPVEGGSAEGCDLGSPPEGITLEMLEALGRYNLELVNADRAFFDTESDGAEALVWSDALWRVAMCHAKDMCDRQYFAHANPDGDRVRERIEADLGLVFGEDFWAYAENIGKRYRSEVDHTSSVEALRSVVDGQQGGYMDECQCFDGCPSGKQAGHRHNILNPTLTDVGIGVWYCAADQSLYNVQNFWRTDLSRARDNPYCGEDRTEDPPSPSTTAPAE